MTSFFNSKAMKKIFRLFAAFAAVTMAFSCMEEANPEMPSTSGTTYEGPTVTLKFNIDKLETKTIWEDDVHDWVNGDKVKIVYPIGDKVGESEAIIYNDKGVWGAYAEVGEADTYYAVYPATSAYTFTTPEGATESQFTVVIPQTQDGSFGQANIMVAKTDSEELSFSFKNVTHIFKFTLSEDSAYKGFQFMSNSSSNHLTGGVPVSFDEEFSVGGLQTVTIGETKYTASSIVQVGDLEKGGTYYVGIHPGADMSYGFGFKATKQGGTTGWSEGALSTAAVDVDRLKITSIANLDKAIRKDWFFKPGAQGDGSSWENAGGESLLVKLLGDVLYTNGETTVAYNMTTNGWRLYGASLHLSAGTFVLPQTIAFKSAVNNRTAVYGGYPDNLTGTTLKERDASTHKTIISKDGGTRLFAGNGSNLYDLTWDGITFTFNEGTTTTERGGAFYFNGSTKGKVKFTSCVFKDITNSHSTGGGAIDVNSGDQTFDLTFTDCDFINNHSSAGHGGAVIIESGSNAVTRFVGCNFKGNSVTGSSKCGGAIYNKASTLIVDNCSFIENLAPNGSNADGSAIYSIDSADANEYTGAIANLYVYNSYFEKNQAKRQGTIRVNGVGYVAVVNSTFNSNTSNNNDCDIFLRSDQKVDKAVKAYIVSCTLSDGRLYSQSCNAWCYNSVFEGYYANGTNPATKFTKSIFNVKAGSKDTLQPGLYTKENTLSDQTVDYAGLFGNYSEGVTLVNEGIASTNGMSFDELKALGETIKAAMPLFDVTKLTVDQKGNSREGKTIMGAYVGQ